MNHIIVYVHFINLIKINDIKRMKMNDENKLYKLIN